MQWLSSSQFVFITGTASAYISFSRAWSPFFRSSRSHGWVTAFPGSRRQRLQGSGGLWRQQRQSYQPAARVTAGLWGLPATIGAALWRFVANDALSSILTSHLRHEYERYSLRRLHVAWRSFGDEQHSAGCDGTCSSYICMKLSNKSTRSSKIAT